MAEKKITEKDIKENIEEMENALRRNDIGTAAEAVRFLLINAKLLSVPESVKVSKLIQIMLEKAKNKRKK